MALTPAPYQNTVIAPSGGANPFAGQGQRYDFVLSMPQSDGEVTIILTDVLTGVQTQLGAGEVTGLEPNFAFTYNNKVYVLSGATTYFSAINDPTTWNDPTGNFNGFVTMSNFYATQDDLQAIGPYQGRLAFFSSYTIQFWIIDPNPANWQQAQVLTNVGTFAPFSVASLGDLDVLFLDYTGIRSLRVRETTLNAFVNDIGSPIDSLVQGVINNNDIALLRGAYSTTDPSTGRYWLFVPDVNDENGVGKIYVLSYYPSSKIIAWSTYDPSYSGDASFFTPQVFQVFHGQVYCRSVNNDLLLYGGTNKVTYDACTATIQLPFFDLKQPSANKQGSSIDADVMGTWNIYVSGDWITGLLTDVADQINKATYDQGWFSFSEQGTHFSLQATTNDASDAKLSSLTLSYEYLESPVD